MAQMAQLLLADFGRSVGIENLAFDDNSCVNLSFDDTVLWIEHIEERSELLVHSNVGDIPPVADGEMFGRLLDANHAAAVGGLGTIGFNRLNGQIVYLDRTSLRGLTQQQFQDFLRAAIERIEFWRKALKGPFLATKAAAPAPDEKPDALSRLIRI